MTLELLDAGPAEVVQRKVAAALDARHIGAGDRVLFCLPSSAALLLCVLGALRRGVVPVLLNANLLEEEREPLIRDAMPSMVITDPSGLDELVSAEGQLDLAPHPLCRPMHYTSGTTGRPKGVWSGVFDEATAKAAFDDEADLWAFDSTDTHLVCSPMYHSVSIRFAAGTLLRGGRLVILSRFDARAAVEAIARWHPTTTFMAPTVLARLIRDRFVPERFESLRLLVHAGSPCPPALKHDAMAKVGPDVLWEFYGSTEGQFTACSPPHWLERPGTVGRARAGRSLSVDPDGTIWCRAPSFARFEYWGDAEATARAWRDGAFTVGDLGRLDDDGFLYLQGRRDDLVITGGVNVYPAEVEGVLSNAPGVEEIAVFGQDDDEWGQRVCAAYVGTAVEQVLRDFARAHLAPHKRPKVYFRLSELPRSHTGKLLRRELRCP